VEQLAGGSDVIRSVLVWMGRVIAEPLFADSNDHRISRIRISRALRKELRLALFVPSAHEDFPVVTARQADMFPIAIHHPKLATVAKNKGCLQSAASFAECRISLHRNALRRPVSIFQVCRFPAVKKTCVARLVGAAN